MAEAEGTVTINITAARGGGSLASGLGLGGDSNSAGGSKAGGSSSSGLPLLLGRMGRIINAGMTGGVAAGLKLSGVVGAILAIGDAITFGLSPLLKVISAGVKVLGAFLIPLAIVGIMVLKPILFILIKALQIWFAIWKPILEGMTILGDIAKSIQGVLFIDPIALGKAIVEGIANILPKEILPSQIANGAGETAGKMGDFLGGAVKGINETVGKIVGALGGFGEKIWEAFMGKDGVFPKAWGMLSTLGDDLYSAFLGDDGIFPKAWNAISTLPTSLYDALLGDKGIFTLAWVKISLFPNWLYENLLGKDSFLQKAWDGLVGLKDWVVSSFTSAIDTILNALKQIPIVGNILGFLGGRQFGGLIPRTGAYVMHAGEQVITRDRASASGGGGPITINVNNPSVRTGEDIQELAREISRTLQFQMAGRTSYARGA